MSWLAVNHKAELTAGTCGVTGLPIMTIADMGWLLLIAFWLWFAWKVMQ